MEEILRFVAIRKPRPQLPDFILTLAFEPATVELLRGLRSDPATTPLPAITGRLETELNLVAARLTELEPPLAPTTVFKAGRLFFPAGPAAPVGPADVSLPEGPAVPTTIGSVRPAGIGSLLLVAMQIKSYDVSDVAHIENVLARELKTRTTRRFTRREETLTIETETTSEEERDLQSTERFELQQETSKTIQENEAFNIGASVTAGYGPYFQVSANTGFSSATSTTEMEKKVASYAKEVIDRSVTKLTQRIKREQTIKTIEEFEETNEHGLDNTESDAHIIGVYRWVNRVYEAQIFDYGLRTMFDFMVPEPATFIFHALEASVSATDGLFEPQVFNTRPQEIDSSNYRGLVHAYRVVGVKPPPPLFLTVARSWSDQAEGPGADFTKAAFIEIDPGYHAVQANATASFVFWTTTDGTPDGDPLPLDINAMPGIHVNIGRDHHKFQEANDYTELFILDDQRGQLAISLATLYVASYAVNVEVLCQRDQATYDQWQLDTHALIMEAYLKMKADYEDKLTEAAVQAGVEIEGRNPLENRLIERAELKKQCISLLTAQHFDLFGAILGGTGFPRIDFDEAAAEGRYIRFFEQAFEWEHMSYVFYPYFWGAKSRWLERVLHTDVDPMHAEFLKAGAARVVAPVRPGFESAVLHFLETGQVWNGDDLPEIGNPLYVDILEEIRERDQAPGSELPVGDPWDIVLPTTLVRLSPDGSLPRWEKNDDGDWVEVTTP